MSERNAHGGDFSLGNRLNTPIFRASLRRTGAGRPLIESVVAACARLAKEGWAELLAVHGLDICATILQSELGRELDAINRPQPGFEDFAICRLLSCGVPHSVKARKDLANTDAN